MNISSVRPGQGTPADPETKLRDAVNGFQSLFIQQLFSVMRESIPEDEGLGGGGFGEQVFTEQMDGQIAASWSRSMENSPLSRALYEQLRQLAGMNEAHVKAPADDTVDHHEAIP
jgi:Rod binding domain-containing protein